jgi:predicted trehalose synthase
MTIERADGEIIIKIPNVIDVEELQRLLNYLLYREAVASSEATQEQVDELARELNRNWWEENKDRLLNP